MAMTREEFAAFVKPPQLQFISDCIRKGLSDYADSTNYSPFARLAHTTSLKSHIRNGHIVFRAEQAAHERPELRIRSVTRRNRRLFYINEKGRLSFKKLNKNLRHSNYPTPQALAFDAQLWPRDLLPDVDTAGAHAVPLWSADVLPLPATNLVGGYVANEAETEFQVYIVCPDGEGYAWEWQLTPADIAELLTASEPAATAAASKIRKHRLPIKVRPDVLRKQGTDDSAS